VQEEDANFVYLALELCPRTLVDLQAELHPPPCPPASTVPRSSATRPRMRCESHSPRPVFLFFASSSSALATHCHSLVWAGGHDAASVVSEEMRQAMLEMAEGMAHLHALSIVHRDLKPQNILVSETGRSLSCLFFPPSLPSLSPGNGQWPQISSPIRLAAREKARILLNTIGKCGSRQPRPWLIVAAAR